MVNSFPGKCEASTSGLRISSRGGRTLPEVKRQLLLRKPNVDTDFYFAKALQTLVYYKRLALKDVFTKPMPKSVYWPRDL